VASPIKAYGTSHPASQNCSIVLRPHKLASCFDPIHLILKSQTRHFLLMIAWNKTKWKPFMLQKFATWSSRAMIRIFNPSIAPTTNGMPWSASNSSMYFFNMLFDGHLLNLGTKMLFNANMNSQTSFGWLINLHHMYL
jgi:hypothetical protein